MRARVLGAALCLAALGCNTPPPRFNGLIPDESPSVILRTELHWRHDQSNPVSLTPDLPDIFLIDSLLPLPVGNFTLRIW
jgi:hypothetical protein